MLKNKPESLEHDPQKSKKPQYDQRQIDEAATHFYLADNADVKKKDLLLDYLRFLHGQHDESDEYFNQLSSSARKRAIQDDAEVMIDQLLEEEIFPIITIKEEFWSEIEANKGISEKETAIPGVKAIVGTLGKAPYSSEGRKILRIKCKPGDLEPRITGASQNFDGVVHFRKAFIPLEDITDVTYLNAA